MFVRAESVDGQPYVAICPAPAVGSHEANARLIAAAPELLAALKDLLPYAEKHRRDADAESAGDRYPRIRAALERARAAVARAEGRR
jgi:hypothetical protein